MWGRFKAPFWGVIPILTLSALSEPIFPNPTKRRRRPPGVCFYSLRRCRRQRLGRVKMALFVRAMEKPVQWFRLISCHLPGHLFYPKDIYACKELVPSTSPNFCIFGCHRVCDAGSVEAVIVAASFAAWHARRLNHVAWSRAIQSEWASTQQRLQTGANTCCFWNAHLHSSFFLC